MTLSRRLFKFIEIQKKMPQLKTKIIFSNGIVPSKIKVSIHFLCFFFEMLLWVTAFRQSFENLWSCS